MANQQLEILWHFNSVGEKIPPTELESHGNRLLVSEPPVSGPPFGRWKGHSNKFQKLFSESFRFWDQIFSSETFHFWDQIQSPATGGSVAFQFCGRKNSSHRIGIPQKSIIGLRTANERSASWQCERS